MRKISRLCLLWDDSVVVLSLSVDERSWFRALVNVVSLRR